MITETDIVHPDGRTLHAYATDAPPGPAEAVVWLHGTPNIGSPPEPLVAAARASGLRWISYDRPGYGGSSPHEGRAVASAAGDVAAIADALGIDRFAVFGHSGGGPHALACATLLPERVTAAVSASAPAPMDADGLDWSAGSSPGITAENRAAAQGRAALEAHWARSEPEEMDAFFTDADIAALDDTWSWLAGVAGAAVAQGTEGMIEDLLAATRPWGFRPEETRVPVLLLHGHDDRMVAAAHGRWLAAHCPSAEARIVPGAGHITVLDEAPNALAWLRARFPA
ncbi:alpha/beta hydrolase [Brachybacterium huguangmaarense]|uniref:Alpha/beta hydrolase n=1 Tax=Brachybacterium huguangmaarense TaxID=1652028 RepID=A0ABY6G3B4_9MICO|nr:alpha/beta hydrolase [Brachybacterium huguangmaarense]UYG17710.1 alpha/beta hydrolase [Brachybacterium huguangmaarense]